MKNFVLMLDPTTTEQEEKLLALIKNEDMGWWHYMPGSWLLKDHQGGKHTASGLVELIGNIIPNHRCLVVEVSPIAWSARVLLTEKDRQAKWLDENWRGLGKFPKPTA